jgi:hypothetical protein
LSREGIKVSKAITTALETLNKELQGAIWNSEYHLKHFKEYEQKLIGLKEAIAELESFGSQEVEVDPKIEQSFVCKQKDITG